MVLTWDQVHRWRLAQHHLLDRTELPDLLQVVSCLCGLHAQLMSAAELALWARMSDFAPVELQSALWEHRTLVKTWAMRGTLHLLTAADFPVYIAARQAHPVRRPPSWFTYHHVSPEELAAIIAGVQSTLRDTGMTREQLADAIAEQTQNDRIREVLLSGWGALLKPSAFQGDVCFGPNQGRNVTFVRPEHWLGGWPDVEPQHALQEIVRRYLAAYGPTTPDDFARWWGFEASKAKRLFRSLANELETVEVEGWTAWALTGTIQSDASGAAEPIVNLLPGFDPYTVALCRYPAVLPEEHKSRVSRPQGWISPVVLVDGRIVGVWSYESEKTVTVVQCHLFNAPSPDVRHRIEAEAHRLGPFLKVPIEVVVTA